MLLHSPSCKPSAIAWITAFILLKRIPSACICALRWLSIYLAEKHAAQVHHVNQLNDPSPVYPSVCPCDPCARSFVQSGFDKFKIQYSEALGVKLFRTLVEDVLRFGLFLCEIMLIFIIFTLSESHHKDHKGDKGDGPRPRHLFWWFPCNHTPKHRE